MTLNQIKPEFEKLLPPTDSRFRPDVRQLELRDVGTIKMNKNVIFLINAKLLFIFLKTVLVLKKLASRRSKEQRQKRAKKMNRMNQNGLNFRNIQPQMKMYGFLQTNIGREIIRTALTYFNSL